MGDEVVQLPGDASAFKVVALGLLVDPDHGGRGWTAVVMPRGRGLRRSERELVGDFAGQLSSAFRTLRLESQLASQVDELEALGQ